MEVHTHIPKKLRAKIKYVNIDELVSCVLNKPDSFKPLRSFIEEFDGIVMAVLDVFPKWKLITREMIGGMYINFFKKDTASRS